MAQEESSSNGRTKKSGPRPSKSIAIYQIVGLALLVLAMVLSFSFRDRQRTETIPYSTFRDHVEEGLVERVLIRGHRVTGELAEPLPVETKAGGAPGKGEAPGKTGAEASTEGPTSTGFETFVPEFGDEELLDLLEANGVEVRTRPASDFNFWMLLVNVLPLLFLVGIFVLVARNMRQQGQGLFNVGKSKAKLYDENRDRQTTFDDVAGALGAKEELGEIVHYLRDSSAYVALGANPPRGILMVGPPGTGKTLLARAVAGEADCPFFSISGSDFMEMFVGVGASRVRDIFKKARERAPCIIFMDELDSIGRRRGAGVGGGHDEREQTLNQFLSEMDGFEPHEEIIVMAATNRPDVLDPALLRPGRFDRQVEVHLPTREDRKEILRVHARKRRIGEDVDFDEIAAAMPGSSGADLENVLNEAALLAARDGKEEVDRRDVEKARDKILLGLRRRNMVLSEGERKTLAYHESGHALLAVLLPKMEPVHKVSIIPRGRSMGVTQQVPERESYLHGREYLADRMVVMMGGRAAERIVNGDVTSGAENDLKEITKLARRMTLDWGMDGGFGLMAPGSGGEEVFLGQQLASQRQFSEATARKADESIHELVENAFDRARKLLEEHRDELDRLAERLLEREELLAEEVGEIAGKGG
jgi:cell division protease FtsH